MSGAEPNNPYVSRGGLKLKHAIDEFHFFVDGLRCADFGCNIGGFTDCLLKAGAAHVAAVDTGYGALAWTLRNDPRVRVMERTNALHAPPPADAEKVDLVVIDMAWTPQRLCVPAALRWLKPGAYGRIITLVKPHYELDEHEKREKLREGVLDHADAAAVVERVLTTLPGLGARVLGCVQSPILGGAGKGKKTGNAEWLALLGPAT